ncbi:hypothetical protein C8R44DRAFT_751871 [Mycena epipterygia]|nr:hypothetical protein C8R44DRAFT_751871 [Mycena epipterygia]
MSDMIQIKFKCLEIQGRRRGFAFLMVKTWISVGGSQETDGGLEMVVEGQKHVASKFRKQRRLFRPEDNAEFENGLRQLHLSSATRSKRVWPRRRQTLPSGEGLAGISLTLGLREACAEPSKLYNGAIGGFAEELG